MARFMRAVLLVAFALACTGTARAQLAPGLVGKLGLSATYVTGTSEATDIAFGADGRAVITSKSGTVYVRRANGTLSTLAYPFGGTLDTASEKGLLGVVPDPNVGQNQTYYFYVSNGPTTDKHRVYRAVLTASDTLSVDPNPIIGLARGVGPGLEGPANHDGGGMIIYAGKLYVGVGDTGSNATPPVNKYASCLNKGNGKILRVNLDGSVPSDNPLVGVGQVTACSSTTGAFTTDVPDPRIFAWGLRNPWRFWIDSRTGLLFIGDVGESTSEEIAIGGGNAHYGYPFVEGSKVWGDVGGLNCATVSPGRPCTPAAYAYDHSVGSAVTGGLIPAACGWTQALGGASYFFGDSSFGWVRALPVTAAHTGFSSTTPVAVADFGGGAPVSFRMGPDGALYVVLYGLGAVARIAPVSATGPDCPAGVPSAPRSMLWLLLLALPVLGVLALRRARRLSASPPT